ncbi:MAG: Bacteriophage phiC31 resistance [Pseudomonadota bacterium]
MTAQPIRPLLDLPADVQKVSFVMSLGRAINDPAGTFERYAVTPAMVRNFREALGQVKGALDSQRGQPVFLRGAFGSGKSHFMAALTHLIAGAPEALSHEKLHELVDLAKAVASKRLLQLHFHMLDKKSLEEAIFGGYIERVRALHPDAPLPALWADAEVFDNAEQLRRAMGDERFFAQLGGGAGGAAAGGLAGFGKRAPAQGWDAARYEAARASADLSVRQGLFDALVRNLLQAYAGRTDRFVPLDAGLGALSRHAHSLGYGGVVLYLDELILWLMTQTADPAFVQREINKLVKLAEAGDERRPAPIISFIARQRELREVIGEAKLGAERATIDETLGHHKARFSTVELSERNLRAIIPVKVARPRDAAAAGQIKDAFELFWRKAKGAMPTLQAGDASREECEQVYPFTPALIQVLVALSDRLQRDRTAVRILTELLVEHEPDLLLGEVVPVGDIFDLVISGEDAVDGESTQAFARARSLFMHELMPAVKAKNGTDGNGKCQREREGHPVRIGCSGCPVLGCRNDLRLVKTALLAALVPAEATMRQLTVSRMIALNYGAVRLPTASMEIHAVSTMLQRLSASVNAVTVGKGEDPVVEISLQSLDLGKLLRRYDTVDTGTRRRGLLRALLWQCLGLKGEAGAVEHEHKHHQVSRGGQVVFTNVRTAGDDELRCPDRYRWQLLVDFPFDDPGHTPQDDEARLRQFTQGGAREMTVVWLPDFLSEAGLAALGDLVRLTAIVEDGAKSEAMAEIPLSLHAQAQQELQAMRARKQALLQDALAVVYGVSSPSASTDTFINRERTVTDHVRLLWGGGEVSLSGLTTLVDARDRVINRLLDARYPRHPPLKAAPSAARVGRLAGVLERLFTGADEIIDLSADEAEVCEEIGDPLGLLTARGTRKAKRLTAPLEEIERAREREAVSVPTMRHLTGWMDPNDDRGLTPPLAGLIAWAWAAFTRREARQGGKLIEARDCAKLDISTTFVQPPMPTAADWTVAVNRLIALGVQVSSAPLSPRSLAGLVEPMRQLGLRAESAAAVRLPARLQQRWNELHPEGAPAGPARLRTAQALAAWIEAARTGVGGGAGREAPAAAVTALAQAPEDTSMAAIGRALQRADAVATALDRHRLWGELDKLRAATAEPSPRVEAILLQLRDALGRDELVAELAPALDALAVQADALSAERMRVAAEAEQRSAAERAQQQHAAKEAQAARAAQARAEAEAAAAAERARAADAALEAERRAAAERAAREAIEAQAREQALAARERALAAREQEAAREAEAKAAREAEAKAAQEAEARRAPASTVDAVGRAAAPAEAAASSITLNIANDDDLEDCIATLRALRGSGKTLTVTARVKA